MATHHDSGRPMQFDLVAGSKEKLFRFKTRTRQVSIRNVGNNTLWLSFNGKEWFDVACGTAWDDRVNVDGFWYCTQTGETGFVGVGLQLQLVNGEPELLPKETVPETLPEPEPESPTLALVAE